MQGNPSVRRVPPLNALRSFESAARHRSFLKAAAELNVTPGAVSRLVKSLEEYLNVELFLRSHRGVALTDEGRDYADAVGDALEKVSRATERLLHNYQDSTLRICCYPTFAVHWLVPRWGQFQAAFPDAMLDMKTSLTPELEDPAAYDLIVRIGRTRASRDVDGVVNERVLDVDSIAICSPDFLARHPQARSLEHLPALPLIHAALRPNDWDRWLESAGSDVRVGQRGMTFESLTLTYNAALSGVGVAIGARAFVAADLAAGRLVQPVAHQRPSESGFNMYYSAARAAKRPRLRQVIEWIRSEREKTRQQAQ